jgi:hypothetical protein
MEDVADYVRDSWSSEGAEVLSVGKSSMTVNLPFEFRQLDDALDELTEVHDVSTDLILTETGANLRVRRGRPGLRQRSSSLLSNATRPSAAYTGPRLLTCNAKVCGIIAGSVAVLFTLAMAILSRPQAPTVSQ